MKYRRFFLLSLILLFSLSSLYSQQTEIHEPQKVRVGYFYAKDYQEGNENSIKTGAGYDFLQKVASYSNWTYEYVYGSFADLFDKLVSGEIDVLNDVTFTEERSKLISFTDYPQAEETTNIYCLPKNEDLYRGNFRSINGKTAAILTNSIQISLFKTWAKENQIECNLITCDTVEELFDSINSGKADIMVYTNISSNSLLSHLITIEKQKVYIAVSNKSPDILHTLNRTLALIRETEPDFFTELFERYTSYNYSSSKVISEQISSYMNQHKTIRVSVTNDDMPFFSKDKHGNVSGFTPEILAMIFENLGITDIDFEYICYNSFEPRLEELNSGDIDILFPLPSVPYFAETNNILISKPVISNPMAIIHKKRIPFESIKKVGYIKGLTSEYYLKINYPQYELSELITRSDTDIALTNGLVDGLVTNLYKASSGIKNNPSLTVHELDTLNKVSFVVRKDNTTLLEILNRGLTLCSSEEINKAFTKYASREIAYTSSDFLFDYSFLIIFVLVALVLISVIAIYNWQKSLYIQKKLQAAIENTKEQQRLLEIAKKKAETSSVAKTTFLFNMSHDIRTPMNAILGYTNMARKYYDDKEKVNDCLQKIDYSGQHLLRLINELLDMARIESGKITQKIIPCNLSDITVQTKNMIQQEVESKGITLEYEEKNLKDKYVLADELHINQILLNILNNAIKYTEKGGTIKFLVQQNSTFLTQNGLISYSIVVEDTGIGMSRQFLDHIYEPFAREKSVTVSGKKGTGLGMSIVKHLIDLMKGHISVSSEIGVGTKVMCTFFLKPCNEDELKQIQKPVVKEKKSFKGKRILLVEDNQLNREIAKDILEEYGFVVDEADDGTTCLEKYRSVPDDYYYFILMDIQMPKMDGYTATLNIRTMENKKKASIPIIAVTANAFEEDKHKSAEAGMNAHIAKPINPEVLIETISRFCY